jgi:hypothetical protein
MAMRRVKPSSGTSSSSGVPTRPSSPGRCTVSMPDTSSSAVLRMPSSPAVNIWVSLSRKMPSSASLVSCAQVIVCESRALYTLSMASAAFCVAISSFGALVAAAMP